VTSSEIDALYGLPLKEFTPARNALASKLSKAGKKDEAARVKKLAKPSIGAWAINRIAREHPGFVERFLKASDRLLRAQMRSMSGSADSDFADAIREQRDALNVILELAPAILEADGHAAGRDAMKKPAPTSKPAP
jgi:hypothetical protein